jgi:hypothetical protein
MPMRTIEHAALYICMNVAIRTGKNAVMRLSMDASMRKFIHALCMQIMHTCVHSANMP